MQMWWHLLACASLIQNGLAAPTTSPSSTISTFYKSEPPSSDTKVDDLKGETKQTQEKMLLRIMPLGASITFGVLSTDGNGYREDLRDMLISDGFDVDMVGNHAGGNMKDNQTEGYPGFIIDRVHDKARIAVPQYKPNLILINAGLNDCIQNVDTANAGTRMRSMIEDLYKDSPQTTVILSTLLTNADASTRNCIASINRQYTELSAALKLEGRRIVLADMQPPSGPTLDELSEGAHPNDQGYQRMADVWFKWIQAAAQQGLLQKADTIN
ncbi:SGNH hydrolase-type esterase domain-containing protein [Biscogniauxia marginata]|nr:SGNH hydrolase-type esterase domain-containing protein [Biscogniauxia marginata]